MIPQRRHFPHFDSIRGLAVMAVLLVHSSLYAGIRPGSLAWRFVERLDVAVPIFLVISGFLLYRPFAAARLDQAPTPWLSAYAWQRAARIVPGYWVALTISALVLGLSEVLTPSGIPTYYGFGQVYSSSTIAHGIPQAWTLGIEVIFYAFLPAWILLMRRPGPTDVDRWARRELLALGVLALASLAYKVAIIYSGGAGHLTPALVPSLTSMPAYADQFALGMGLAVLSVAYEAKGALPRWLRPVDRFPGLAWTITVAAFVYGAQFSGLSRHAAGGYTHGQYLERHYLNALIAVTFVIPAIFGAQSRGLVRRLLALRPLAYIGMVSYGLYLYHELVLAKLWAWGYANVSFVHPYVSWFLGCLLASLIPASVSWYLLERPALRLQGRLRSRRRVGLPPESAAIAP